jgi:hypothetical protein
MRCMSLASGNPYIGLKNAGKGSIYHYHRANFQAAAGLKLPTARCHWMKRQLSSSPSEMRPPRRAKKAALRPRAPGRLQNEPPPLSIDATDGQIHASRRAGYSARSPSLHGRHVDDQRSSVPAKPLPSNRGNPLFPDCCPRFWRPATFCPADWMCASVDLWGVFFRSDSHRRKLRSWGNSCSNY